METRVGFGYDVHRFADHRPLMLGGVKIPYSRGLEGHSDADVLIHAIMDALLGAAGLRDIGFYFPDNDLAYKGADSKVLLSQVKQLLVDNAYVIGNIDSTLCLEEPKVMDHIPGMLQTLSAILGLGPGQISIKATTNERMGFVGRKEGVAAFAVATVRK